MYRNVITSQYHPVSICPEVHPLARCLPMPQGRAKRPCSVLPATGEWHPAVGFAVLLAGVLFVHSVALAQHAAEHDLHAGEHAGCLLCIHADLSAVAARGPPSFGFAPFGIVVAAWTGHARCRADVAGYFPRAPPPKADEPLSRA